MGATAAPGLQHGCIVFSDLGAFEEAGEAFLREGAARGERVLYLDRAESRRRYGAGTLEPREQVAVWRAALRDALNDGSTGLRVVADLTDLVPDDPAALAALARYEHLVDRFMATTRGISGRCGYDATAIDPAVLTALAALHGESDRNPSPVHLTATDRADLVRLAGELDGLRLEASLPLLVGAVVVDAGRTLRVDAADLAYVDHRSLRQLDDLLGDVGLEMQIVASRPLVHRLVELAGTRRVTCAATA